MSLEDDGWRITPVLHRSKEHARYTEMMADLQRKDPSYKKREATTDQSPHIAATWDAKNNKLKDMTEAEIAAYQNRPLPTKEMAAAEADAEKIMAEQIAKYPTRIQDYSHAEHLRRLSKNTQGDAVSMGMSGASKETKEMARQAFSFTPPAPLTEEQKARLTELNLITTYVGPEYEWKPVSFWESLWMRITGRKVRAEEKKESWRDYV